MDRRQRTVVGCVAIATLALASTLAFFVGLDRGERVAAVNEADRTELLDLRAENGGLKSEINQAILNGEPAISHQEWLCSLSAPSGTFVETSVKDGECRLRIEVNDARYDEQAGRIHEADIDRAMEVASPCNANGIVLGLATDSSGPRWLALHTVADGPDWPIAARRISESLTGQPANMDDLDYMTNCV